MAPQTDFGPDLASLGSKTVSQLEFGNSKIARTPVAYIEAKITDPHLRECRRTHAAVFACTR